MLLTFLPFAIIIASIMFRAVSGSDVPNDLNNFHRLDNDLNNLYSFVKLLKKAENSKPTMMPFSKKIVQNIFPESLVTSQFIENILNHDSITSGVPWERLLREAPDMLHNAVLTPSYDISLIDYAVGHLTSIGILNQDLLNMDEYLNELNSPELFKTPLVIDMDKCILEWDQNEDIVHTRPFLSDLFKVLSILSDQFEVFFHTLAQKTVAERYIFEMEARFETKKLGFDFTLISYENRLLSSISLSRS